MKKIISLTLIFVLLLMSLSVSGASVSDDMLDVLKQKGIMNGDPDGNLRLSDCITRAEAVKMIVAAFITDDAEAEEAFEDVTDEHWAYHYIIQAKKSGIVHGDENGLFNPESNVSNNEYIKMLVCSIGFAKEAEENGGYPEGYVKLADEKGITQNIGADLSSDAVREDIAVMTYNAIMINENKLNPTNLYVISDSVCQEYTEELYPRQGFGAVLGDYVSDELTVHNYAVAGRTTKSFLTVGKDPNYPDKTVWQVIKEQLKPGDWVLVCLGINDASVKNVDRTTVEEYEENLKLFVNEARQIGADVILSTPSIRGGDYDSELGWEYTLPEEGVEPTMDQRWIIRANIMTEASKELGCAVIPFGKTLSETYEAMYEKYMSENPDATVADGRNYVRSQFHLYVANIKAPVEEGGFGVENYEKADDSTHINIKGAHTYAATIAKLISETDTELAAYMKTN